MKKIYIITFLTILTFHFSYSQTPGEWTWVKGDSIVNPAGVFGMQGIPSAANVPPGLYDAVGWVDQQGNLWLFGGFSYTLNKFCDLWKYDISANMWTWVKGPGIPQQTAVQGVQGVADIHNNPGINSWDAASWVDNNGDFWLFGGSDGAGQVINLLWRYNIASNEWTYIKGDTANPGGVYGIKGVPGIANYPAARYKTNANWVDANGNLWLFGGNNNGALLNDVWKYNIAANTWTWMKGDSSSNATPVYGTMGVADSLNTPGGRQVFAAFKDLNGDFWTFGGRDDEGNLNDWWKFNIASNNWTWMAGSNLTQDSGHYGTQCIPAIGNYPQQSWENNACWTDSNGGFWLYGGFENYQLTSHFFHFDPLTLKGTWVAGPDTSGQLTTYGTKGVSNLSNYPGARIGSVSWLDKNNHLWMFGGWGEPSIVFYNDLWRYVIDPACPQAGVAPPVASFQSSQTTICTNDCIPFTNNSTNATSWLWSFAGGNPTTSTDENPSVCYLTSGIYSVTLVAYNSSGNDTLAINNYINVTTAPQTPVVTQVHNDTLFCNSNSVYTGYQWYFDSTLISGATDTFLVITKSGNYNVEVTNENGCKVAAGINIVLGLQNYMNNHVISVSPNPAGNKITISGFVASEAKQSLLIEIYNVLGEIFLSYPPSVIEGRNVTIDISSLVSGVYFVRVENEKSSWVNKIIKQ